ncbi:MAG: DUF1700 domain-containing protein [Lachnospiraceae bacterium]|nr:DUF1700 domain-containing protein [Lachnospiraceae bacterium]
MNKYEFIRSLRKTLTGKVDGRELEDTIRYYEDYIDGEIKKGKTESQVLQELGDPRLLAKNIASVNGNTGGFYEEEEYRQKVWQEENHAGASKWRVPGWLIAVLILLAVVVILGIAFSVIWSMLPLIIPVCLVISLFRFFTSRR